MSTGTRPGADGLGTRSDGVGATSPRRESTGTNPEGPGRRLSTETKSAFKTTEFIVYVAALAGVLIAAAAVGQGTNHHDPFTASAAWLYVTILTLGYMLSRGIAKSGSRQPYDENR
jgi:hypothetical protein